MTEFINISQLYLYEKHIPLELRINFVYNTLYWYWLKPADIPDYCYYKIMTLVNESLHEGWYFLTNIHNSLVSSLLKLNKMLTIFSTTRKWKKYCKFSITCRQRTRYT